MSGASSVPSQALTIQRLGTKLHRIEGLLDHDEFTLYEVDGDYSTEHELLGKLIQHGALEKCGTEHDRGTTRNRYRWVDGAADQLRAYLDDVAALPCGHHVHIYNPHDSAPDELGCKVCAAEGVEKRYPKPLVRDLLSNRGSG